MITAKIKQAIHDANKAHGRLKQTHGDLSYIVHLVEVMTVAIEHGITDEDFLCACILHDIVEDTHWNYDKLKEKGYSDATIDLVLSVTDDYRKSRKEQLADQIASCEHKTPDQLCLKLCDRIANLRSGPGQRMPSQSRIDHTIKLKAAASHRMSELGISPETGHPFWALSLTLLKILEEWDNHQ